MLSLAEGNVVEWDERTPLKNTSKSWVETVLDTGWVTNRNIFYIYIVKKIN